MDHPAITSQRTKLVNATTGPRKITWSLTCDGGPYMHVNVLGQPVDVINVYDYATGEVTVKNPTRSELGWRLTEWLSDNRESLHHYVEQAEFQNANARAHR